MTLEYLCGSKILIIFLLGLTFCTPSKIDFISGINGSSSLKKLVNSKKFNIAFKLCPTNISSVMSIADKNKFMPPKSTWFHPKPLDGLISSKIIS